MNRERGRIARRPSAEDQAVVACGPHLVGPTPWELGQRELLIEATPSANNNRTKSPPGIMVMEHVEASERSHVPKFIPISQAAACGRPAEATQENGATVGKGTTTAQSRCDLCKYVRPDYLYSIFKTYFLSNSNNYFCILLSNSCFFKEKLWRRSPQRFIFIYKGNQTVYLQMRGSGGGCGEVSYNRVSHCATEFFIT